MGDKYDVMGNFKNLKSKDIFKNFNSNAIKSPVLNDSLNLDDLDADLNLDLENAVSPKKKVKKELNKKTETTSKTKVAPKIEKPAISTENSELEVETRGIARRTRSSLKNNDQSIVEPVANTNKTKKNTKKTNKSNNNVVPPPNANTTRRRRGRMSSAASVSSSTTATTTTSTTNTEVIEIGDCDASNEPRTLLDYLAGSRNRQVMRARREYLAQKAAACPTVEVVDLITSPLPPIKGVIDVDLEDDIDKPKQTVSQTSKTDLDISFEEDNPEMSIKINWQCKPEMFKLRKYQKFSMIFEQIAQRENIAIDKIFLNLNDHIIQPSDTPASIGYKIFQFIDGRSMSSSGFNTGAVAKKKRDPNLIKLKIQADKWKKPLVLELLKTDNFQKLKIKCAEELKIPFSNILKLSFDGDILQNTQTPLDLELEGGEVIEIHLID